MNGIQWYNLDENKNVVPMAAPWEDPHAFDSYKLGEWRVAHHYFTYEVDGKPSWVWVATDFLGLDHRFGGEGPPIVFETMFFDYPPSDQGMIRCSTWRDALILHEGAVNSVRRWLTSEGYTFTESTEQPKAYAEKLAAERARWNEQTKVFVAVIKQQPKESDD